jgi:hypothetical protein
MKPETIEQAINELGAVYGDEVRSGKEGSQTLVRINAVELYPSCRPSVTPMLLVFDLAQPKPFVYVQPGQLLANGRAPKNSSTDLVGGESWMKFSFNIPWTEGDDIKRFVAAARQRFSQDE